MDHTVLESRSKKSTTGVYSGIFHFVIDYEEAMNCTLIRFADDIKLGVTVEYAQEQCYYPEGPKQARGMGLQEPYEIQGQVLSMPWQWKRSKASWARLTGAQIDGSDYSSLLYPPLDSI